EATRKTRSDGPLEATEETDRLSNAVGRPSVFGGSGVLPEERIHAKMAAVSADLSGLLGRNPRIAALREQMLRVLGRQAEAARRSPPVLILGETGTGKGLVAAKIHRASVRARGPFVDVNCAAIPETLLEAELFGWERGAFTGARQAKPGLFQAANAGTIFLDEIGLLPASLQSKLLKVIEERQGRPRRAQPGAGGG